MPEWPAYFNGEFRAIHDNSSPAGTDWRESVDIQFAYGQQGTQLHSTTQCVAEFRTQLRAYYEKNEPCPPYNDRLAD